MENHIFLFLSAFYYVCCANVTFKYLSAYCVCSALLGIGVICRGEKVEGSNMREDLTRKEKKGVRFFG